MIHTVRRASVEDAAGIAAAHVASWQTAYRGLLPDPLLDNLSVADRQAHWTENLAAPRPRTDTLVVTADGTLAGFVTTGPRRCENPGEGDGELYAIYLHPDHWGHGAGYRLHQHALQRLHLQGFSSATLWVLTGNERAISFYRRTGWHTNDISRVLTRPDGTEMAELQLERRLAPDDLGEAHLS